jgi:hypothetical protein
VLISIHMPKTAGLSLRATLEEHFAAALLPDYQDYPLAHTPQERQTAAERFSRDLAPADFASIGCIHGHFLPAKYLSLVESQDCQCITWLRQPVARLISHYAYWRRSYDASSAETSALHRRVVEEGWTLEQFCLTPELRNVYSQFLWGFPLDRLDFVGITEYFAEDLRYFSTGFLSINAAPQWNNRRDASDQLQTPEDLDEELCRQIEEYHAQDMQLYQWAIELRANRRVLVPGGFKGA